MADESFEQLLATLFLLIRVIAGYPEPDYWPAIHRLPQAEVAQRVCGGPCPVRAAFIRGEGVLIDAALDFERDAFAQSVLIHELVHYVQDANGAFNALGLCRRHTAREGEAYFVQDEYLQRTTGHGLTGMHGLSRAPARCFGR